MSVPNINLAVVQEEKRTPEEDFRFALEGITELAKTLAPFCTTLDEVIGMADCAIKNDGQLRLLMALAKQSKK